MKQTFSTITIIISIAFFALLVPQAVISEEKTNKPEKKEVGIKDYDFSYWLSFMNYHPQILIEMGDTAELLFSTRKGKTLDQLEKEGFKVSEERIAILKAMNLLKEVKVYKTAFPIMDPEETRYMRTISKKIALDMATPLKEDIQELMSYLKSEGYSKNAYTILFSYVLDNLVWKEFRKIDGFITHEDFTPEKPIWNGLIYAMYPPRASNCGTNSSSSKGITLSVNWSEASMDLISKVRKDSAVSDMFKDLQEYGEFKNKKAIRCVSPTISAIRMVI
ncbi:hypothetical protein KKB18_09295 [bacterium]|nr:hypothetical protein [bacterium]